MLCLTRNTAIQVIDPEPELFENQSTIPCGMPVANTTFEFEIDLPSLPDLAEDIEDAVDQSIIDSRKGEPTESMEKVFSDLGIR